MEQSVVGVAIADEDGRPRWDPEYGGPLVPGHLAWDLLTVGHRRETWLCWSVDLWAPAVVKVVRPNWKPEYVTALEREVRALSALRHPALPRLLHDGRTEPVPFIAVEYMDGYNLAECVEEDGAFRADDTAALGVQVLGAVRALHSRGLAHMDVDPFNVLVVDRRPRLVDLGSSRPLGAQLQVGEGIGTQGFAPPEADRTRVRPVTPAFDVYGVGATLRAVLDHRAAGADELRRVIDRMTDDDPGRRPTVEAAMTELVRLAGDEDERPWPDWADGLLRARAEDPAARAAS
ncbi:protein kinase [Geodermatophilus sp. SYSU D00742]